jgi:fructosamine-3-kinase
VGPDHPLLGPTVLAEIERAATAHRGRRWAGQGFTSLDDRGSHPCGILHGTPFSVFAKLGRERRLLPMLRVAADSGHLPPDLASGVEAIADRLPALAGPEPRPALLHGDAQQHNFVSTAAGAFVIDPAPYFGHPEVDLALVGYFQPVPDEVFTGYQDLAPIDPGFAGRRELWRLHAYLAVAAVAGPGPFGRRYLDRLAAAIHSYR